jgi:hypothetical protein
MYTVDRRSSGRLPGIALRLRRRQDLLAQLG